VCVVEARVISGERSVRPWKAWRTAVAPAADIHRAANIRFSDCLQAPFVY